MTKNQANEVRISLFWKILLAILVVGILPLLLISYNSSNAILRTGEEAQDVAIKALDNKSIEALYLKAHQASSEVEALLEIGVQDVRYASLLSPAVEAYLPFYESRSGELWYQEGRVETPLYKEMTYIDADGQEIIRIVEGVQVPENKLRNVKDAADTTYKTETYFSETKDLPENKVYVSPVMAWYITESAQPAKAVDASTSVSAYADYETVIRFATPVFNNYGEFQGILVLSMDYRHLMEKTNHIQTTTDEVAWPDYASGNYAYMLDYEGWLTAHPNLVTLRGMDGAGNLMPTMTLETISEYLPFNMLSSDIKKQAVEISSAILAGNDGVLESENLEGALKVDVYVPIHFSHGVYEETGIFGGVVLSQNVLNVEEAGEISKGVINKAVAEIQGDTIWIAGFSIIIFILAAVFVSRSIIDPVRQLTDAARIMEEGELDVNILKRLLERKVKDEVSELARVFKQMAEAVQLRERRLREEVQELKIQIDVKKKEESVNKIVESEMFQRLREKAKVMRAQRRDNK